MDKRIAIREATKRDIPAVVDFYARLDDPGQREWIEIMMDGRHPYVDASHFLLAEDRGAGRLAACVIYMPWTYSYGGCMVKGIRLEHGLQGLLSQEAAVRSGFC